MSSAANRPRPPDPDQEQARDRIGEALLDLCFAHGYRSLSLQMLLDRAEIDEAVFGRHFDDLDDCFCTIYEELRDELMEGAAAAVAAERSWRDGLRAALYAIVDFVEEDQKRTHLIIVEARSAGDRAVDLIHEGYERMFDYLDRGREERPGSGTISRATAEAIGGSIFFQMYSSYTNGSIASVREKVPKMMYTAVLPYLGREAAEEELSRPPA
jgi:AcrR family transcriptional regulator